jgi:hypothetical protein
MVIRRLGIATTLAAACLLLGACATGSKQPAASAPASEVQVYSTTQLVPTQYTIVQHIWTDEWRSNISLPTYRKADDGLQALKEKAASAGASGLVNVMCLDATGYSNGELLCYGDAIRFNN